MCISSHPQLVKKFATLFPSQSAREIWESWKESFYYSSSWTKKFYKGGPWLLKSLIKDHMDSHIHDLVVLLHRIKDSPKAYLFDNWMYHFIDIILEGKQYLDWAEIIASSMSDQLKLTQTIKKDFFMSSYLVYCLACTH